MATLEQVLEFQANMSAQTYDLLTRVEKQMAATHSVLVHQEVRNILSEPRYKEAGRVVQHGWKGQSQFDEDGILEEIFNRIGIKHYKAIEIGAGVTNERIYCPHCGHTQKAKIKEGYWLEKNPDYFAKRAEKT